MYALSFLFSFRSHRIGRKREGQRKPRAIVVKFNFHQDRERIRLNARKLRGTRIGIAEQFPEEIEKIRQTLYPELRLKRKDTELVRMVRDKLYINNVDRSNLQLISITIFSYFNIYK